jgi:hypothetical protein
MEFTIMQVGSHAAAFIENACRILHNLFDELSQNSPARIKMPGRRCADSARICSNRGQFAGKLRESR